MVAKEELLRRARGWTEHEATVAMRAVERERHAHEDVAEEWGDALTLKAALQEYDSSEPSDGREQTA